MKIIELDRTRLIIQLTPIGLWIFGLVFTVVGLFVIISIGTCVNIECKRTDKDVGTCKISSSSLLGTYVKLVPVDEITSVDVESYSDSDGDDTYKVVLKTKSEKIPFSGASSSGYSSKEKLANRINDFLQNEKILELNEGQDDRLGGFLIGGVFFLVGAFITVLTSQYNLLFDKTIDQLTMIRKNLLGKNLSIYKISEIKEAYVEESSDSDGTTYRVVLLMITGPNIPLSAYYSSGFNDKQKLALSINNFLKS